MIRLGMLDFDTSHAPEFVKRLNHVGVPEEQWVQGAQVVVGCPGESRMMPERIAGHRREIESLGVPLVEKAEEMIGRVDGMLILSQEGGVHRERARPFLEAGLPCFIDKPFTCSLADARELVELADRNHAPIFSASSLRYAPEVVRLCGEGEPANRLGALAYGPGYLEERNPGLFQYGIHAVEMLHTLMGPGCEDLSSRHTERVDVVTAHWRDGRVGHVRTTRGGQWVFGCVVFDDGGARHVPVGTEFIYRELLRNVVDFFQTRRPPVPVAATLEIIAFLEAAERSAAQGGVRQSVRV